MKKINRIISIITSLSLTFISNTYIVSAKKATIQSPSFNQSETAEEKPVIKKSISPKNSNLKQNSIPDAIDPKITSEHLKLLKHMKILSYMYAVDSICLVSQILSFFVPLWWGTGIAVAPIELIVLIPIITRVCVSTSIVAKVRSLLNNQPF